MQLPMQPRSPRWTIPLFVFLPCVYTFQGFSIPPWRRISRNPIDSTCWSAWTVVRSCGEVHIRSPLRLPLLPSVLMRLLVTYKQCVKSHLPPLLVSSCYRLLVLIEIGYNMVLLPVLSPFGGEPVSLLVREPASAKDT